MGVIDKFLNAMKMNDDDVLDDDFLDDDYDDESYEEPQEERPKRRILSRSRDDDSDRKAFKSDDDDLEMPRTQTTKQSRSSRTSSRTSNKISPMRSSKRSGGMEVCVIKPKSIEDAREVTETLLDECTVILNMEGTDFELAQRIIDFACGSCYAIHGKLQKVSNYIFIITPPSVDISGDFQEIMSGSYDIPSFGTSF
ncbi:MAG: cell division protein SepF [Lachnospiraceae bacterium]|nr:cell division protein SepF [Lachnospiraceae bacterium]